jgi:transposase InsO family protein
MIDDHKERFGVEPVCRVLEVPPSTYYAQKKHQPSARQRRDEVLLGHIKRIHQDNYGVYGARRIAAALRREGIEVALCTVERLMRRAGLQGVIRGGRRRTTIPEPAAPRPPDLVNRRFTASRPNQMWVADLTYVRTWTGWVYVAFVLDVYSRMIVGWQLAGHLRTDLPLDALEMALYQRDVHKGPLIHHSDRGCQYTSIRYAERLNEAGIAPSVGSVADSYDNAMAEAMNGTFKAELIDRQAWRDRDQVERAVVRWVGWYNHTRLHGEIGHVPPAEYEAMYYSAINTPRAA